MGKKKIEPNSNVGFNEVEYKFYSYSIGILEGKMLTLIEASIQDTEQRKALKDIVRQTIWTWAVEHNCDDKGKIMSV